MLSETLTISIAAITRRAPPQSTASI